MKYLTLLIARDAVSDMIKAAETNKAFLVQNDLPRDDEGIKEYRKALAEIKAAIEEVGVSEPKMPTPWRTK